MKSIKKVKIKNKSSKSKLSVFSLLHLNLRNSKWPQSLLAATTETPSMDWSQGASVLVYFAQDQGPVMTPKVKAPGSLTHSRLLCQAPLIWRSYASRPAHIALASSSPKSVAQNCHWEGPLSVAQGHTKARIQRHGRATGGKLSPQQQLITSTHPTTFEIK